MPRLIKDGELSSNDWKTIAADVSLAEVVNDTDEQLLVPFPLWQEHKTALAETGKTIGVWLDSEDDPYALAGDTGSLPLIALNFPVFRDGRAFSSAAIVRERLGYEGELRAIGDVLRDQLFYMKKCGINSFELQDNIKVEDAQSALNDFRENYQSTVETPEPLFKRRLHNS